MKNQANYLKIYLVPLLIVFLFSKMKAESYDSAFSGVDNLIQKDSVLIDLSKKNYEIANKLFEDENYSKSLEIALSLLNSKDDVIIIKVNHLLGKVFEKSKDIELALKYFKKSLSLIDEKKINVNENHRFTTILKFIEAENLLYLSKIYVQRVYEFKITDSSFYYLDRLVKIESINDNISFLKARAFNNLSIHEFTQKEYKKAEEYSFKAIDLLTGIDKPQELSMAYLGLANIYEVTNKREKALKTYFNALTFIEKDNDVKSLGYKEALYYNIAWTMYNMKDYKAYEYLEKSYDLKDSLINVGLKKELKKIERTHNIDLIRKEEENKRDKLVKNTWFIGISGALVSLLFLYLANLNKLKQRSLSLQLSQKELEQNKKLEKLKSDSQAKIINATIDGKETERKVIAETLHDNVSALLSSARMHLQATQKQIKEGKLPIELEKTQQIILEASTIVRDLSHNLVSSVLLKFGLEYAIKDTAKKFSNSTIKIHTAITDVTRYDQEFEIKIYNITQEFINNILKHSKATSAYVVMEEENDYLLIIVKDNGCGFQVEKEDDNGIGLNQIEARIDAMGGVFSIESSEGEGTKIMVNIPVVRKQKPETTLA